MGQCNQCADDVAEEASGEIRRKRMEMAVQDLIGPTLFSAIVGSSKDPIDITALPDVFSAFYEMPVDKTPLQDDTVEPKRKRAASLEQSVSSEADLHSIFCDLVEEEEEEEEDQNDEDTMNYLMARDEHMFSDDDDCFTPLTPIPNTPNEMGDSDGHHHHPRSFSNPALRIPIFAPLKLQTKKSRTPTGRRHTMGNKNDQPKSTTSHKPKKGSRRFANDTDRKAWIMEQLRLAGKHISGSPNNVAQVMQ